MHKEPKSICVLRLSAIGDVCHALSVVQQIQRRYPSCNITWIMGKIEAQLLGDLEGINVVVFDKKRGFKGMKEVWQQLKGQRFDYLLHMQVALRASLLTLGIKAKKRVGFSWHRAKEGQWLFTNVKLPTTGAPHVLDNFAQFALYLDCPAQEPKWNIPLAESDYSALAQLGGKPYIVISPAASKDERNWLPERYASIADYAAGKGYQVVLCGAPTDRERRLADSIISFAEKPIHNLVGQTSLKQLTAVLSKAEVVIAPDSGPAHIATTQGTPVIGLYAHSNPRRTGPYNSLPYVASVYEQVAEAQYGKAVSDLPWGARVKGADLMSNISVELVEQQLDKVLTVPQAEKSAVQ
ncbi:glycosyltransferase family 9 protein [Vibrio sp. JPW-9-11-11]|uniref:glycosyltransferase family 9 protein n=1 Tax=Vibrio sp. JPW-9-11-11 TaxID=1416532 RepID=UPI001592D53C|nr:glycosyltransferase family 9 protein [Vibrio sp. JPW-9-11-11]NVD05368.1 glycosyltransferase family 9 protein [Vibrio sp. JPW-9-11-11]